MSKELHRLPYELTNNTLLRKRELGIRHNVGHNDDIARKVYTSLDAYQADIPLQKHTTGQGGIFNLEFSLDGRLLVAACEEKSILMYDASNQRLIKQVDDAHNGCVNCVRFLDPHTFATCSDDSTIKIWDTRHLKNAKRTLQGHSNWVKNIEYSEKENLMVTSAFDGSIYAWDLKNQTENNVLYDKVFVLTGLMRTKLTPDGSKMIICTTTGYMIIIHDLNLATLSSDMKTFRPSLYRLMQLSEQAFPAATMYNYLFYQSRKSNRIEFVADFPNSAELISSLQIHPMGWCTLSRNIDNDDKEEWTCVHDIQTRNPDDYEDAFHYVSAPPLSDIDSDDETNHNMAGTPSDIWMGFLINAQVSAQRAAADPAPQDNLPQSMGIISSGLIGRHDYNRHFRRRPEDKYRIVKNLPRLTHFIKEKTVGKGFIKELCFSGDGRIICSPYDKGIRLLGFNEHIQELCYCVPDEPKELFTLAVMKDYHPSVVVSCKFSPRHYQMVSGCLGGEIVWYKPIL